MLKLAILDNTVFHVLYKELYGDPLIYIRRPKGSLTEC